MLFRHGESLAQTTADKKNRMTDPTLRDAALSSKGKRDAQKMSSDQVCCGVVCSDCGPAIDCVVRCCAVAIDGALSVAKASAAASVLPCGHRRLSTPPNTTPPSTTINTDSSPGAVWSDSLLAVDAVPADVLPRAERATAGGADRLPPLAQGVRASVADGRREHWSAAGRPTGRSRAERVTTVPRR